MKSNESWYLPKFMRDFHDQKGLFKAIDEVVGRRLAADPRLMLKDVSWVQSHVYVVDFFLWFMARHGWTLQPTRRKGEYADLGATLRDAEERRVAAFAKAMDARRASSDAQRGD